MRSKPTVTNQKQTPEEIELQQKEETPKDRL
jgi:hypothetical protein